MRTARLAGLTLLLAVGTACFGKPQGALEPTDVVRTVAIANALRAAPDDVEGVLADHGVTRGQLEEALFTIAADPDLAQKYASLLR